MKIASVKNANLVSAHKKRAGHITAYAELAYVLYRKPRPCAGHATVFCEKMKVSQGGFGFHALSRSSAIIHIPLLVSGCIPFLEAFAFS